MLFALILLLLITATVVIIFTPHKRAIIPSCMYISLAILLLGLFTYYLKTGGFSLFQRRILLTGPFNFSYLVTLPLSFNKLAVFVSTARLLFSYLFLLEGLTHNLLARTWAEKHRWVYFLLAIPYIAYGILSIPKIFTSLFSYHYYAQRQFSTIGNLLIITALTSSLILDLAEYFNIQLSYIKKHHKNRIIANILLGVIFLFFALFEPIVIFQNYSGIKIENTLAFFKSGREMFKWTLTFTLALVSTIIIFIQVWKFYKINYDRERKEMTIKEKMNNASVSSTVLIHSIKNQLLTEEILINSIKEAIKDGRTGYAEENLATLSRNIVALVDRLNVFYRSFSNLNTVLLPVNGEELFLLIREKLKAHNIKEEICYDIVSGEILCDKELLSEAIYNLILNAAEAVRVKSNGKVEVTLRYLRAKTVIRIKDNGPGIPSKIKPRLFTPFSSTKNSLTNWGLGLCYSNQIVKKHQGEIRLEETGENGTSFIIALPLYKRRQNNE